MSRAPEKIGRLFTLYMRLDLETILITVKNSILLGNTNTFEINSFSYGGVSYPTEDALSKIEEIRNYVNDTVDEVLKEILNQLPNCISNGQRIQRVSFLYSIIIPGRSNNTPKKTIPSKRTIGKYKNVAL